MSLPLTGKIALVTGGSRGIGRAVVQRLTADGARVVFTYHTAKDAADALAAETGAEAARSDQADLDTLPAVLEHLRDGLDILVNNAAVAFAKPISEITPEDFDRLMTINTKYPTFAIKAAMPLLRDGGRIINVSSLNTAVPAPGGALYSASKAALEQITKIAARELGPRRITVNTVSPGAIDTEMLRSVNTPDDLERAAGVTALQRLGTPADVAAVIAFLAGPDSAWITGQNLHAGGGFLI